MKILRTMICAALLVAGLCGCEKQLIPEINLADNLEGSWEKVYPEGVQQRQAGAHARRGECGRAEPDRGRCDVQEDGAVYEIDASASPQDDKETREQCTVFTIITENISQNASETLNHAWFKCGSKTMSRP